MKIYLDVSSLNRPLDDQTQPRIRLEAEAVTIVLGLGGRVGRAAVPEGQAENSPAIDRRETAERQRNESRRDG